ncbi:hypothetical protein FACS1894159_08330 [Bacteroidia bacterium]|nr:hypothetical protein FACS1894159_08330 [Bacteroidia bacterium]
MIKSMTGYGKGEVSVAGKKITAELRSLNSKQFDLSLRMPQQYRQWEYELRNMLSRSVGRGKVELVLSVDSSARSPAAAVDRACFEDYYGQLIDMGGAMGLDMNNINVTAALIPALLRMPEVVSAEVARVPDQERLAAIEAVGGAVEALDRFRLAEGAALIADLLGRVDLIMELLGGIAPFEAARADAIRSRIREQIESMGLKVDHNRLEQEMIYYIEKIDITEEKVRLANHCDYFRTVAAGEQDAGRKLGFIAQEMGREINTLGSKANQVDIQKTVVEMKDQLERIKEQVLNIL